MAAKDLNAKIGVIKTPVGEQGLDDWRHQLDEFVGFFAFDRIGMVFGGIKRARHPYAHCPAAFVGRACGQKHPADIGMHQQGVSGFVGAFGAGQCPALQAVTGIGRRPLIGGFAKAKTLNTDRKAFLVHHGEHGGHALMGFTDQIADCAVKIHDAGGGCLDAHLVFDRPAFDRVAIAKGPVIANHEFRDKEQGNALGPLGRIGQFGQNQMDDVFRQIMFPGRDENLGAGNGIGPVFTRFGLGLDDAKIGTAMRFGQAHGASPRAVDHFRKILVLQFVRGVAVKGGIGSKRQARIHPE